jgi:endoglucanase
MQHNILPCKSSGTTRRVARLSSNYSAFFATLAATIGLIGCSSDPPAQQEGCEAGDWHFPNCISSEYVYTGTSTGPCVTPDNLWQRSNCSDPLSGVCINAAVCGGQLPPVPSSTGVNPVSPVTSSNISPTGTPTNVSPQSSGVAPVAPSLNPTGSVNPVAPVAPVSPTGGTTSDTGASTSPVAPTSGETSSEGPPPVVEAMNRTCPAYGGLIADFEEPDANQFRTVEAEGRIGVLVANNDGSAEQTFEVVAEGDEACNSKVLHTSGSGFGDGSWAGLETVLTGVWDEEEAGYQPNPYDATALGYDGISFRAKKGASHENPIKFSLSVPASRAEENGGDGSCNAAAAEGDPDQCWNHPGHFLIDDEELTTDWKTYTFCINGDLYPTWLPFVVSPEQRVRAGSELMTLGFEFNKTPDSAPGDEFDFYVDDIKLVKDACNAKAGLFTSTEGTAVPFGSNVKVGSCDPIPNAGDYNRAVSEAYARWKANFLGNDGGVKDPQTNNRVVSEGIGYGMLITAAMGDKPAFDSILGWASPKMSWTPGSGAPGNLLGWENGANGSATDADTDMAYALYMAGKQWGGTYAAAGAELAAKALTDDVSGNILVGGDGWDGGVNPSYFSPGFYKAFDNWGTVASTTLGVLNTCSAAFGDLLPDWCSLSGAPSSASNLGAAQAAPELCEGTSGANGSCLAMDAARVPLRLGYGVCIDGTGQELLQKFLEALKTKDPEVANGERMDLLKTGWDDKGPLPDAAVENTMAFVGPVAVGAWALGEAEATSRDRAFRATLDIIQDPEYYEVYYQSTVALLSLLTITGNWPTP